MSAAFMALSKREYLGVAMALTGLTAGGVFVYGLVGAWHWWQNPELDPRLEPRITLCSIVLTPLLAATTWMLGRLRVKAADKSEEALPSPLQAAGPDQIRRIVMANVRREWLEPRRRAVARAEPIRLGVEDAPDAIVFSRQDQMPAGESRRLRLTDDALPALFDESAGSFIILGDPGCGKTFTLAWLAERLLLRAEADPAAPVPVVVPLASWGREQKPLDQWLAKELVRSGLTPRDTSALLAERGRIVLLLDGLDEVREEARAACVEAILEFKRTFQTNFALSCRDEEYGALACKFTSGLGIRVLPVSEAQVDEYFAGFGPVLEPLQQARREQPELRSLGNTPLMLNVLTQVATAGGGALALPAGSSLVAWRDAIFTRYVEHAFARREVHDAGGRSVPSLSCSTAQAVHYLQQIARRMEQGQRTRLYLEQLRPSWVNRRWKYALIDGVAVGMVVLPANWRGALVTGLLVAAYAGFLDEQVDLVESVHLRFDWQEMVTGPIVGLSLGLAFALFSLVFVDLRSALIFGLAAGAVVGVVLGLIGGFVGTSSQPEPAQPNQGVRNSLRIASGAGALLGWAGAAVGAWLHNLPLGSMVGFWMSFLYFGGSGITDHYAIRLAAAWEGTLPYPLRDRKLIALLDALRDRILLVRRGGGWDFYHGLLREFLAGEPFGRTVEEVARRLGRENSPASLPAAKASMTG